MSSNLQKLNEISNLIEVGHYSEAFDLLEKFNKIKEISEEERIKAKILKSYCFTWASVFDNILEFRETSLNLAIEAIEESRLVQNDLLIFDALFATHVPSWYIGRAKEMLTSIKEMKGIITKIKELHPKMYKQKKAKLLIMEAFEYHYSIRANKAVPDNYMDESIRFLNESLKLHKETGEKWWELTVLRMLAIHFSVIGDYSQCLATWNQALEVAKEIRHISHIGYIHHNISTTYHHLCDFKSFLEHINKAYEVYTKIDSKRSIYLINLQMGNYNILIGERNKALELFEKCLIFYDEINCKPLKAASLNSIGLVYQYNGDLDKALEYFKKAYKIFVELGETNEAGTLYNISEILLMKGELDEALKIREDAYQYWSKLQSRATIVEGQHDPRMLSGDVWKFANEIIAASFLTSIAEVHWKKGSIQEALDYSLRTLSLYEDIGDKYGISYIYGLLILISTEIGQSEKGRQYLLQLEAHLQDLSIKPLEQYFLYLKASILKISSSINDIIQAEVIFEQLLNEELEYRLLIDTLLSLCELYIDDLRKSNDSNVLKKLKVYVAKLYDFSIQNDSYPLTIETLWMQSQIALIELDYTKAKELMKKANLLAQGKNLERLKQKLSTAQSVFEQKTNEIRNLEDKESSISSRIDIVNLKETISVIRKERLVDVKVEQPINQRKLFSLKI